jgi:hypothetical protein
MKLRILLPTLFLVFTSLISNTQALTKQEIAKTSLDSTVVVVVTNKQGNALQFGSGFVIKGGMVVSNQHVISGGTGGYILANDEEYKILGVLASDEQNDLVILKISEHPIPQLSIHSGGNLKVGADVYVAGNPLGLSGTFSEGMLSSIRKVKGKQLYQITAPISQGSSGGPVLDRNAVVVGVITSYIEEGQSINFAAPSVYLNTLINNIGPLSPLSSISSTYTETNSTEITQSEISKIKPKTNKEGKLTDICCAFGVELGKKLNPELLDTETLMKESIALLSIEQLDTLLLKKQSSINVRLINSELHCKRQEKFVDDYFDKLKKGGFSNTNAKWQELKKVNEANYTIRKQCSRISLKKVKIYLDYNFLQSFIPENPYEGFDTYKVHLIDKDSLVYRIEASGKFRDCEKEKSVLSDIIEHKYDLAETGGKFVNYRKGHNRFIDLDCSFTGQTLTITYEDSELKSLKDKIYKKKLRSHRDSSGL